MWDRDRLPKSSRDETVLLRDSGEHLAVERARMMLQVRAAIER